MLELALVTYRALPDLDFDDRPLVPALNVHGIRATPVVWDDPSAEWAAFDRAVIRSTWDYHTRRDEFLEWIRTAERATTLWNPPAVLRWNTDKRYLQELHARGVPIVPTRRIASVSSEYLAELLDAEGWDGFVLKPSVSADSFRTGRFDRHSLPAARRHLAEILGGGEAMVQPYYPSVETLGERSLLYLGGRFSHAIRKPAALGPDRQGKTVLAVPAEEDQQELARRVLALAPGPILYARIDQVADADGRWRIMEAEFTEPSLYLGWSEGAAERFAGAIAGVVKPLR